LGIRWWRIAEFGERVGGGIGRRTDGRIGRELMGGGLEAAGGCWVQQGRFPSIRKAAEDRQKAPKRSKTSKISTCASTAINASTREINCAVDRAT